MYDIFQWFGTFFIYLTKWNNKILMNLSHIISEQFSPVPHNCWPLYVKSQIWYKDLIIMWILIEKTARNPFQYKDHLSKCRIPIIRITQSCNHVIFKIGIPLLERWTLHNEIYPLKAVIYIYIRLSWMWDRIFNMKSAPIFFTWTSSRHA